MSTWQEETYAWGATGQSSGDLFKPRQSEIRDPSYRGASFHVRVEVLRDMPLRKGRRGCRFSTLRDGFQMHILRDLCGGVRHPYRWMIAAEHYQTKIKIEQIDFATLTEQIRDIRIKSLIGEIVLHSLAACIKSSKDQCLCLVGVLPHALQSSSSTMKRRKPPTLAMWIQATAPDWMLCSNMPKTPKNHQGRLETLPKQTVKIESSEHQI